GASERRDWGALGPASLERLPASGPAARAGEVQRALGGVGGVGWRLQVPRPRRVAVKREARRERAAARDVGALAGSIQAVARVTGVARHGEPRQWTPGAGSLGLPRPEMVLRAKREAEVGASPVALHLERPLGA